MAVKAEAWPLLLPWRRCILLEGIALETNEIFPIYLVAEVDPDGVMAPATVYWVSGCVPPCCFVVFDVAGSAVDFGRICMAGPVFAGRSIVI